MVEDRIVISAPPEAIWQVLVAVADWPNWNPLYAEAAGDLRVGAQLRLAVALPGMKPQKTAATVQRVDPPRRIQYQTVNLGGLVRATRYVALAPAGDGRVEVTNAEVMAGPVGHVLAWVVGKKVGQGLAGMNRALRLRVEAGS